MGVRERKTAPRKQERNYYVDSLVHRVTNVSYSQSCGHPYLRPSPVPNARTATARCAHYYEELPSKRLCGFTLFHLLQQLPKAIQAQTVGSRALTEDGTLNVTGAKTMGRRVCRTINPSSEADGTQDVYMLIEEVQLLHSCHEQWPSASPRLSLFP
ncbi:hypothetical protein TcWFU_003844 [Taenia crassiceps]|uniref:Uncharacterized protein n=1 Tax=Taenia crassiceps TaxID=6207 RepID=A0ABR4QQX0_9CEST